MITINIPTNFISDGCTFPGILKILRKPLGADKYHEFCKEHDFLRRHKIINWHKSNVLLARRIISTGISGWIRAPFYYLFTTITYPLFSGTRTLPHEWEKYKDYYED